jgi:hypothetical protein
LSLALALEIETVRLDHVVVDVLVTPFFACDRPLRGPAAQADWRLCGLLSDRLQREELTGERGEAALFPTGGRMRTPLLLTVGLGPRFEFGDETLRLVARNATERILGLRSGIAGIALPSKAVSNLEAERSAGLVLEGVAAALSERPSALRLSLWVTPEEAGQARAGLLEKASRLSGSDFAIRLDRSAATLPRQHLTVPSRPGPPVGKTIPRGPFPS